MYRQVAFACSCAVVFEQCALSSQIYKWDLICNAARTGCLTTGGTERDGTVTTTGLKSEVLLLERIIMLLTHDTGGDRGAENISEQRSTSITVGNAGPGLVAVHPR